MLSCPVCATKFVKSSSGSAHWLHWIDVVDRARVRVHRDDVARLQVADAVEHGRTDADVVDVAGEDGVGAGLAGHAAQARPAFAPKSYQMTCQAPLGSPICPLLPIVRE